MYRYIDIDAHLYVYVTVYVCVYLCTDIYNTHTHTHIDLWALAAAFTAARTCVRFSGLAVAMVHSCYFLLTVALFGWSFRKKKPYFVGSFHIFLLHFLKCISCATFYEVSTC